MKRILLLVLTIFIFSCSSLPELKPIDPTLKPFDEKNCFSPFPQGKWQFIHSIQATMPNQKKAVVMGITNISSANREIKVVMMTIEGLVLFDAEYDGEINIHKGISPFDSKGFAKGLMDDIGLIFFKPCGRTVQTGFFEDGSRVCRFKENKGNAIDVYVKGDDTWEIKKYSGSNKLIRHVKFLSNFEKQNKQDVFIPEKIELFGFGNRKYSLQMDLIEANRISN